MGNEQEPVIIVDEKGNEHEFPAGMDPKRAAAIVRGDVKPMASHGGTASALATPGVIAASKGLGAVATRIGEEVATSPLTGRAVKAATGKAAGALVGAIAGHGATGAAVGYGAGEVASNPVVQAGLEAATRGGGGMLAKLGGMLSRYAGPAGIVATMPFTDSGDRPVGETWTAGDIGNKLVQRHR